MATPNRIELLRRTLPACAGQTPPCAARRALQARLRCSVVVCPARRRHRAPRDAQRNWVAPSRRPLLARDLRERAREDLPVLRARRRARDRLEERLEQAEIVAPGAVDPRREGSLSAAAEVL